MTDNKLGSLDVIGVNTEAMDPDFFDVDLDQEVPEDYEVSMVDHNCGDPRDIQKGWQMHPVPTLELYIIENDGHLQFLKYHESHTPKFLEDKDGNRLEIPWDYDYLNNPLILEYKRLAKENM